MLIFLLVTTHRTTASYFIFFTLRQVFSLSNILEVLCQQESGHNVNFCLPSSLSEINTWSLQSTHHFLLTNLSRLRIYHDKFFKYYFILYLSLFQNFNQYVRGPDLQPRLLTTTLPLRPTPSTPTRLQMRNVLRNIHNQAMAPPPREAQPRARSMPASKAKTVGVGGIQVYDLRERFQTGVLVMES